MKNNTRIRIAAVSTSLFLAGIAGGAFGSKVMSHTEKPAPIVRPARTQTIHRTRVKTIHVRPKRKQATPASSTPVVASSAPPQAQPVVQQAPTRVTSQTSPSGGGGEDEGEQEHEGGDDD